MKEFFVGFGDRYADMIGRYRTPVGLLIVELYAEKGVIRLP